MEDQLLFLDLLKNWGWTTTQNLGRQVHPESYSNQDVLTQNGNCQSHKLIGILKRWFWWIAGGRAWPAWVRTIKEHSTRGPKLSYAFPPGTQPGSHGENRRRIASQVLQGERKSRHYETLFTAFSIQKAYSLGGRTLPGQILDHDSSCSKEIPPHSCPLQSSCLMQGKTKTKTKQREHWEGCQGRMQGAGRELYSCNNTFGDHSPETLPHLKTEGWSEDQRIRPLLNSLSHTDRVPV